MLVFLFVLKIQEAIDSLFSTWCPKQFWSNRINSFDGEDFEGSPSDYYTGTIVKHIEACCGRQSIRNPWRLYPSNRMYTKPISISKLPGLHVSAHAFLTYETQLARLLDRKRVRLACKRPRDRSPRLAHSFVKPWSWKHFYGHSPSSADSKRAVVSYWRKNVH